MRNSDLAIDCMRWQALIVDVSRAARLMILVVVCCRVSAAAAGNCESLSSPVLRLPHLRRAIVCSNITQVKIELQIFKHAYNSNDRNA